MSVIEYPTILTLEQEILLDSPIFFYELADIPTTAAPVDSSGYGQTGSYLGIENTDYTLGVASIIPNSTNLAIQMLTGSGGVATPAVNLTKFSVEFWAAWSSLSSAAWGYQVAATQLGGVIQLGNGTPSIQWNLGRAPGYPDIVVSATTNTLYHVVATFEQTDSAGTGVMKLVVNGVVAGILTGILWYQTSTVAMQLGAQNSGFWTGSPGKYQNHAIYDYILPLSRIQAHYKRAI